MAHRCVSMCVGQGLSSHHSQDNALHVPLRLVSASPCPKRPLLGTHRHSDWGCLTTHISLGPSPHTSTSVTLATVSLSSQLTRPSPIVCHRLATHTSSAPRLFHFSQDVALWSSSVSFQGRRGPNISTKYAGADGPHSRMTSHTSCCSYRLPAQAHPLLHPTATTTALPSSALG